MNRLKHEGELEHLDPCICTKNFVTGFVLDYDCGPAIAASLALPVDDARAVVRRPRNERRIMP